jgi:hypothetical protein
MKWHRVENSEVVDGLEASAIVRCIGNGVNMNYVRIGKRTLNLDSVSYAEVQVWQDEMTVKVYFSGLANNTPLVFGENDAKELWKYLEYVAEKPIA